MALWSSWSSPHASRITHHQNPNLPPSAFLFLEPVAFLQPCATVTPMWVMVTDSGFRVGGAKRGAPVVAVRKDPESDPVRPSQTFEILKIAHHGRYCPAAPAALVNRQAPNSCAFKLHAHSNLVFWGFKVIQGYSKLNFFPPCPCRICRPRALRGEPITNPNLSVLIRVHSWLNAPHASRLKVNQGESR
jgi:hypothetical protein